jgi:hypothetical protein
LNPLPRNKNPNPKSTCIKNGKPVSDPLNLRKGKGKWNIQQTVIFLLIMRKDPSLPLVIMKDLVVVDVLV